MQTCRPESKLRDFKVSPLAVAPRFPAWQFRSYQEFSNFLKDHQSILDSRHLYQLTLAVRKERLEQPGSCAPCRRPVVFTSDVNGEKLSDGKRMPNWREELHCNCPWRLNNRQRAVLHLAQASGLRGWASSLLLGEPSDFALAYMANALNTRMLPRFHITDGAVTLPVESGSCHFVISQDDLQKVGPLASALAEMARVLVPGGRLIFTVPFHVAEVSLPCGPDLPVGGRRFGWNLLDMLKAAGFTDAVALLYWSEELGYLGNMNFVFLAMK
jgi:SAM-dependent methyltransferase